MTGNGDTPHAAEVEDFRGDFEGLAAVMRASWAEGSVAPYLYTPEFLRDCLRYPGADVSVARAVYDGSELVAFAAGLPRQVAVAGVTRQILIATFVTVAAGRKSSGYGALVWRELVHRAAAGGYEGVVTYCTDGQPMQRIIEKSSRLSAFPHVRVKTFSYLVATLAASSTGVHAAGVRPSPRQLICAAQRHGKEARQLWRMWSIAEAEWQLSRIGSVAVAAEDAALTGSVVTVDDAARSRSLVVDDVLWGGLTGGPRQALLAQLLDQAAAAGATYAVVPLLGYADVRPFLAAGFTPSPHTMHAYLTLWPHPAASPMESFYLDVT